MAATSFKLNTGAVIPALGLDPSTRHMAVSSGRGQKAVSHAISVGYRHIDCAFVYGNEDEVGEGLKAALASGEITRSDIFVTTKLWCTFHSRVEKNLNMSLKSLGLDYVDLYLMHWPCPMNANGNDPKFPKLPDGSRDLDRSWSHIQTYKEMEKLVKTGKTRAVGVANYSKKYLEELLPHVDIVPAVNQIENHPLLPQQEIVDFARQKGIHITAYSPLGSTGSPLVKNEVVMQIAQETDVAPGNVLLSYHIARGSSVLAKSVTPSRIEENRKIIELSDKDMAALDQISTGGVTRFVYPDFGVDFGFPDKQ